MSESTHSIYKTEFMKTKFSLNIKQHLNDLDTFLIYYNDLRYPCEHYGLNPIEVLQGETPYKFRFREQIKNARTERIEVNKAFNQCPILCI